MYIKFLKPLIDFIFGVLIFIITCPLLILSSLLIKLTSKGPLFFFQERLGQNGEVFKIFKFRTMTYKDRVSDKEITKDNPDVTKVGNYLRRYKIDELPQVFNILKGDMSLVGPRPCLPNKLKDFNEDAMYRTRVKPGMTGLAQINGNIYLSWKERWKYDRQYVENLSFLLDVTIIVKTIGIVIKGEDKFINKPNV